MRRHGIREEHGPTVHRARVGKSRFRAFAGSRGRGDAGAREGTQLDVARRGRSRSCTASGPQAPRTRSSGRATRRILIAGRDHLLEHISSNYAVHVRLDPPRPQNGTQA